jgi:hypothetical protein
VAGQAGQIEGVRPACLFPHVRECIFEFEGVFAHAQEGMVPFDIGVPISGDVAIGLWFGAYNLGQRLHSRPAAAYAFHTAFFEENKVAPPSTAL